MNETTVILTRGIFKDDGAAKEDMGRSHDTWVLLLVVSVLSTLLSVIVIVCCLWTFSKFCFNLSLLKTWRQLQCYPNSAKSGFPPNPREYIDMEEIGEKIAELQASKVASVKTGASEHLGYKPASRNFSLPILPTPRSWTPSPPFPQTSHHQNFNTNNHSSCHNCCKNHCHHCHAHQECYTAYEDASGCQICNFEPTRKLTNLKKHCKDVQTPKRTKTEIARSKSAFHLPINMLSIVNSCHDSSQSLSSKKEMEEAEKGEGVNNLDRSFSNSAASRPQYSLGRERNKNDSNSTYSMKTRKSPFIHGFEDNYNSLGSKKGLERDTNAKVSVTNLFPAENNKNNNNPPFKKKLHKSLSNKRYQQKSLGKISKRPNTPMAVAQESASSESSDVVSALSKSSATYYKLYHMKEPNKTHMKDFGEDSKYHDGEPSMSWDHLTPDLSPSTEEFVEAKAEIDLSKATAVFYQEKRAESDSENINISIPTSSAK